MTTGVSDSLQTQYLVLSLFLGEHAGSPLQKTNQSKPLKWLKPVVISFRLSPD
jgi:hypothetical protein